MYAFGDPNVAVTVQSPGIAPRTPSNSGQFAYAERDVRTTKFDDSPVLLNNPVYQWLNELTVENVTIGEQVLTVDPPLEFRFTHDAGASVFEIRGIKSYKDIIACGASLSDAYEQLLKVLLPSLWEDVLEMEEGAKFTKRARLLVEDFRKRVWK